MLAALKFSCDGPSVIVSLCVSIREAFAIELFPDCPRKRTSVHVGAIPALFTMVNSSVCVIELIGGLQAGFFKGGVPGVQWHALEAIDFRRQGAQHFCPLWSCPRDSAAPVQESGVTSLDRTEGGFDPLLQAEIAVQFGAFGKDAVVKQAALVVLDARDPAGP